jgi:hypothetical protein
MKFDLHVHTRYSRCAVSWPAAIIRRALKRGLTGVAVTDHNTMAGVVRARALAPPGFVVIPGAEYTTDHGHILALFCETFADGLARDNIGRFYLSELSPFVREQGGILIAAHPGALPPLNLVDGLESMNSRELSRGRNAAARITEAANDNGLFATGGSDAHLPIEVGQCCTVFPPETPKDLHALRDALKQGLCAAEGQTGRKWHRVATRLLRKVRSAE